MRTILFLLLSSSLIHGQQISGELKQWHDVVLTFDGPSTSETAEPNPFLNYRLNVTFTKGAKKYTGSGLLHRRWQRRRNERYGRQQVARSLCAGRGGRMELPSVVPRGSRGCGEPRFPAPASAVAPDGTSRARSRSPRPTRRAATIARREPCATSASTTRGTQASGKYFIQTGTQSPENFFAYWEFDDTVDHGGAENKLKDGLHRYEPHVKDWKPGDPVWKGGKGKGIIGALNYLAGKGMNTFYTVTMNIDGDGREIYPWTSYEERARYDVSKLAQWEIVLSHMDKLGMQLMVITQEEENEQILGKMTALRKVYYRELIARFAHHHALLWDLSEEMRPLALLQDAETSRTICNYIKTGRSVEASHPIRAVEGRVSCRTTKGYGRLLGFPLSTAPPCSTTRRTHIAQTREMGRCDLRSLAISGWWA